MLYRWNLEITIKGETAKDLDTALEALMKNIRHTHNVLGWRSLALAEYDGVDGNAANAKK